MQCDWPRMSGEIFHRKKSRNENYFFRREIIRLEFFPKMLNNIFLANLPIISLDENPPLNDVTFYSQQLLPLMGFSTRYTC